MLNIYINKMTTMRLNNSNNIVADNIQLYSNGSYVNVADYLNSGATAADLLGKLINQRHILKRIWIPH